MLTWWIVLILVVLFLLIVGLALWLMFRKQDYVPYGKKFRLRLTTTTSVRNLLIRFNALLAKMANRTSGVSRDTIDMMLQLKEIPITFRCSPKPVDNHRENVIIPSPPADPDQPVARAGPAGTPSITANDIYQNYECNFCNELYELINGGKNGKRDWYQQEQYWTIEHVGLVLNIKVENVWVRYIPVMIMENNVPTDVKIVRGDLPLPTGYFGIKLVTIRDGYFSNAIIPVFNGRTVIIPINDIIMYAELYIAASTAAAGAGDHSIRGDSEPDVDGPAALMESLEENNAAGKYFVPCPDRLSVDTFFLDLVCRPIKD